MTVRANPATLEVLSDVGVERERQEHRKREGRFRVTLADAGEGSMTDAEKYLVLGEEIGEAIDEAATLRLTSLLGRIAREVATGEGRRLARNTTGTREALRAELVQVAAVAVAWCEAIDVELAAAPA